MRRHLAAAAGLAATLSIASLVLAEKTTTGQSHRVAVVFLFILFLAAIFTLLAVAIIDSDRSVKRLSEVHEVSPRWSLRATRRRLGERLARLTRTTLTGIARATRAGLTGVAHGGRAGVARVRRELQPERRQETRARLKQNWYAALVVMGMPPKELEAASTASSTPAPSTPATTAPASGDGGSQHAGGGIAQLLAARYRRAVRVGRRPRALLRSRPAGRSPGGRPRRTRASGSRAAGVASAWGRRPLGDPGGS